MTRTKRRNRNKFIKIVISIAIIIAVSIVLKTIGPAKAEYEHKLHLESLTKLDSNFLYANFKTPEGKTVQYSIHNVYEDKLIMDRDYDIKYIPRSFNFFRPNKEIKDISRTIPSWGVKNE